MPDTPFSTSNQPAEASEAAQLLITLFELGREVTSVLDLNELLEKIPQLLSRLTTFKAFAVWLLDEKRRELSIAYAVGYPEEVKRNFRLAVGQGIVGTVVAEGRPLVIEDVLTDPRYVGAITGVRSQLAVPLRRKKRVIGAINLYGEQVGQFTPRDEATLLQFGAHVAVAIENARLFEREKSFAQNLETLAEIGQEVGAILDLDQLLERLGTLVHKVVAYRTLGIFLLDEARGVLEHKLAIKYGDVTGFPHLKLGEGLIGHAALTKQVINVPDVAKDPRYLPWVPDCRSELAVPMLFKDRCIGVIDLESPEYDAFSKEDVQVVSALAAQLAVAIENARLYEALRANEERIERELQFARRVQAALLPTSLPKRLRGVDVGVYYSPARELGGDFHDFLSPESNSLVVAVGDVSGKGVPAALYSVFAAELVRSRTFRRRFMPERFSPAGVLMSINTILAERQLENYYCTLCYAYFDLKRRTLTMANSGLPYVLKSTATSCQEIELPGLPLGAFPGVSYDQVVLELAAGDTYVFFTDGVTETFNDADEEFGTGRICSIVHTHRELPASGIVQAIVDAVHGYRGDRPQSDDLTLVVVKIGESGAVDSARARRREE
jgi:sigma-B regulation protein RsbU (phosphoserine phosphatase)